MTVHVFEQDLANVGLNFDVVAGLVRPGDGSLVAAMARATTALVRPMIVDIIAWEKANVVLPPGIAYYAGAFRPLATQVGIMRCWQDERPS